MPTFPRFAPLLQEAIVSRLGWSTLRPVQELAGEALLDGKNAVVLAPTAGGKTEAAFFPLLSQMLADPKTGVRTIYVAPIKALLNNQEERLGTYTEMVGLRRFVWHGDVTDGARREFIREPAEILMTTPESLEVMLLSPRVPVARVFENLRFFIIDEVHALAGTDRGAQLMSVLERIARFTGDDVQRVGLSATVGNPQALVDWLQGSSKRERLVVQPPHVASSRRISVVQRDTVTELARDATIAAQGKKSLFFCQTRAMTEVVADRMCDQGIDVFVHHSSVHLDERRRAEERFQSGSNACIVATSTLELGLDVGDLDIVFQANAPSTVSSFLQRMGRTGRRPGTVANITFLCEDTDSVLQALALVELAREGWVEPVPVIDRCWPVLVHQLLALTLQFGGISGESAWDQLARVPDFRGIRRDEFDALVSHLIERQYLFEAGGLLSFGPTAEREFGRRNFLEMYAVFSSPVLYRVKTVAGSEIGSIEQDFAERLVEQMSSFLLGGRAWAVARILHEDKEVRVQPAPRGVQPSWGGFIPQLLSYELCQRIRKLIEGSETPPYAHPSATQKLADRQHDLADLLHRGPFAVQTDDAALRWWTFAGGRANYTLKYALELLTPWKAVADNFHLRIEGDGVSVERLREVLRQLDGEEGWRSESFKKRLLSRLPPYRLSKFQAALPDAMQTEWIGRYLLDLEAAGDQAKPAVSIAKPTVFGGGRE